MNTREGRVGVQGVGVDIVDLGAFAASLAEPGTRFERVFSGIERRQARESAARRGSPRDVARHLAARWAAKEAVVKAWSEALYGAPPPIAPEELDWAEISVACDAWGRPSIRLSGRVAAAVEASLGPGVSWHVSLSHEGMTATAFCVLSATGASCAGGSTRHAGP